MQLVVVAAEGADRNHDPFLLTYVYIYISQQKLKFPLKSYMAAMSSRPPPHPLLFLLF
jgi:hypothetical protein